MTTSGRCSRRALTTGLLILGAACGTGPTAPDDGSPPVLVGGAPVAERDAAVVGIWFRRAFAGDGPGSVFSVETVWSFDVDGVVQRRLVTYDLASRVAEELVATGSWTTAASSTGSTVTIHFTAPTPTVIQFPYRLELDALGAVLVLDGIIYRRLPR